MAEAHQVSHCGADEMEWEEEQEEAEELRCHRCHGDHSEKTMF